MDGQQIGLATGVHTRTNVYNRDMFKAAGLDPDKPFTTLDEVVDAGKKLTKADKDIWGLGLYLGPSRATIELYYGPMVWALRRRLLRCHDQEGHADQRGQHQGRPVALRLRSTRT